MSITIKLHVDGKAYSVLDYRMDFHQEKDSTGKPTGRIHGGLICVTIEAMMDTVFHHWAVAPEMMKAIEIVFSPVTRVSQSRTIKLYDVHLARISSHFTNQTSQPMKFQLVLSPGIFVDKDVVHKKPWHVTDLETQETTNQSQSESSSFDIAPEME